jgi:CHAT domain-containing protein
MPSQRRSVGPTTFASADLRSSQTPRGTSALEITFGGRASRVHICAHGTYAPRDYIASSISLPTAADPDGQLVVARILAGADLAGIELAVLGACQSGAGQTEASTLDVAGGIDTAFLVAGVRNVLSALWEKDDLGA